MSQEDVIAVDPDGNERGTVDRLDAHTGDGVLHRAFTCLVFDQDGYLLLARRSPEKRLWGGYWDGTVASHPAPGEAMAEAVRQRLEEEIGVTPDQYGDVDIRDSFQYEARFQDEGLEKEVCWAAAVTLDDRSLEPDPAEVQGVIWVPFHDLKEHPDRFTDLALCPWFEIAMDYV